jgi:hypothetical protein
LKKIINNNLLDTQAVCLIGFSPWIRDVRPASRAGAALQRYGMNYAGMRSILLSDRARNAPYLSAIQK